MAEFNQFTCTANGEITGISENCNKVIAPTAKLLLTTYDFEIASADLANTKATYTTAIEAETMFPLPLIEQTDNNSEEPVYFTSDITGKQTKVRESKQNHTHRIMFNACLHKRLKNGFDGATMRVIEVDNNEVLIGTTPDNIKFIGQEVLVSVDDWVPAAGDTPAFTPIRLNFNVNEERQRNIATVESDFGALELNGVQPATLATVGTPNATTIVVDVKTACDGVGINGLLVGDFIFLESDGITEEVISTATPDGTIDGRYTLSATAFTNDGNLNLRDVVNVGEAYYKGTAITITI
jgi:hypothetical protein